MRKNHEKNVEKREKRTQIYKKINKNVQKL